MPPEDRQALFHLLYPWYKEEVFRRRAQMVWLTAFAFTVLLLLLAWATFGTHPEPIARRGLLVASTLLFSGLTAYLILQQHDRHRQAKQVLIDLERELHLFENTNGGAGKALYPKEWQTAWQQDRSVRVYLTALASMTILTIVAILAG